MDDRRFDRLSKRLAGGLTRRQLVGGIGAGAAIGALSLGAETALAAEPRICRYDFRGDLWIGPTSKDGDRKRVEGVLELAISANGAIDRGTLAVADDDPASVVGQATGRAINLRIRLDVADVLIAVGTGSSAIDRCKGELAGLLRGPRRGDIGDWTAVITKAEATSTATAGPGAQSTGTASAGAGEPCDVVCDDGSDVMPGTCDCACSDPLTTPCRYTADGQTVITCVNLMNNVNGCGNCDNVCPTGEHVGEVMCAEGACRVDCVPGYATCDVGQEPCSVNLMTEPQSCGSCINACPTNFFCQDGACVCGYSVSCEPPGTANADCTGCDCPGGLSSCGNFCLDLASDPNNCGSCSNVCDPLAPDCEAGVCRPIASQ